MEEERKGERKKDIADLLSLFLLYRLSPVLEMPRTHNSIIETCDARSDAEPPDTVPASGDQPKSGHSLTQPPPHTEQHWQRRRRPRRQKRAAAVNRPSSSVSSGGISATAVCSSKHNDLVNVNLFRYPRTTRLSPDSYINLESLWRGWRQRSSRCGSGWRGVGCHTSCTNL